MAVLSVLPYRNTGWDVRVAGQETGSPSEAARHACVVLYVSDLPTSLSHPSCPRLYLPPPGWEPRQAERRYSC